MDSSKRKHPEDVSDDFEHVKKRIAGLEEKELIHQQTPAASSPGGAQEDTPQDVNALAINASRPLGGTYDESINCDDNVDNGNDNERRITMLEKSVYKLMGKNHKCESVDLNTSSNVISIILKERDDIRDRLEATRIQLESARRQNEQLAEDIERISTARQSAPDLDDAIESQFRDLRQAVRSFTREFCSRQILTSPIPDHVKSELTEISGITLRKLLKSGLHARYFVEGLIWRLLCRVILDNPFVTWGKSPEIATFISRVQSSAVAVKRRELWRTMTGQLLNDITYTPKTRIEQWQNLLVRYVKPLVSTEYNNNIATQIEPILDSTIQLAKSLARSRTLCRVQRKHPGESDRLSQKYDSTWMEIVEVRISSLSPSPHTYSVWLGSPVAEPRNLDSSYSESIEHFEDIDFVVTPALVQITNSAGEAFKLPRVLVKAEVCFGQGRSEDFVRPTLDPPSNEKSRAEKTLSGRQARGVDRLGGTADEAKLIEAIGVDHNEVPDSISDEYEPGSEEG
ncbi:hypothetical protein E0Z10_g10449 [Xylaria hypoxylon]|uniref:Uncharacterized protein n=1 Tax=Xylaria hypoxylon TaxID=37992 RepID=A0A4Z0Y3K3_9PEZI|nr:hypothetical protein E0Z10_g10449 [Xylaria hypoxylon]